MSRLIEGVQVKRLKVVPDERGRLMEILRSDDKIFTKFGQVYVTTAYPGVVKGWHSHKIQHDHFTVVSGMLKLVLYDGREETETTGVINEFYLGTHNPILVKVPAGVLHGYKAVSETEAVVINIPTEAFRHNDPDEDRIDPHINDIPYDWDRQDG
jgi:dTDP-4-dehydrorhamnose 3,5-epimerase